MSIKSHSSIAIAGSRRRWSFLAVPVLLAVGCIGMSVDQSQARDVGALGGNGGGAFRQSCNQGDALVGFDLRVGKALDQITAICARFGSDGLRRSTYALGQAGGGGGNAARTICWNEEVVGSVQVFLDRGGAVVQGLRASCRNLKTGKMRPLRRLPQAGVARSSANFTCRKEEAASGIFGRYGALVDRLGLQCAAFKVPGQAPEKVATPIPKRPEPKKEPERPTGTGRAIILSDVDVYRAPHAQGGVIGVLPRNAVVHSSCDSQTKWCEVRGMAVEKAVNANQGYVFVDFVRVLGGQ